jgi:DNA mismatch repair protein MutL
MDSLTALGFDLSDLGGGSFAVAGVPGDVADMAPVALLRNIITDAAERGSFDAPTNSFHDALALSLARNTAIDYGQVLTNDDMERLVNALFACTNDNYTPDGMPILAILPDSDISSLLS